MTILAFVGPVLLESREILAASAPYLLFGFVVAGVIHGLVPADAVARHLGTGKVLPEVKAALVFLLAGPATNVASLTALSGPLGLGATIRYLVAIVAGAGAVSAPLFRGYVKPQGRLLQPLT
jgi:uncharacterized membrane protein YraQ (UPF0718 family)